MSDSTKSIPTKINTQNNASSPTITNHQPILSQSHNSLQNLNSIKKSISSPPEMNRPSMVTKLRAADYDRFSMGSTSSTFPNLSTNPSSSLPILGKPVSQRMDSRNLNHSIPGRPILYHPSKMSYNFKPAWRPPQMQPHRRPSYPKHSKLGFYSPIKVSSASEYYRSVQSMRYNPYARSRIGPYPMRFNAGNSLRSKKMPKRLTRVRKRKGPRTARTAKKKLAGTTKKRSIKKKEMSSSENEFKGDDDYTLPQRSIRRLDSVQLVFTGQDDPSITPLTQSQLNALEKSFFDKQKQITDQIVSHNEDSKRKLKDFIAKKLIQKIETKITPVENKEIPDLMGDLTIQEEIDERSDDSWLPCDVCGVFNSPVGDLIIYCDGCGLVVHKMCYGIRRIPEGDWFCNPCAQEQTKVEPLAKKLGEDSDLLIPNYIKKSSRTRSSILKVKKPEEISKPPQKPPLKKHYFSCVFCPLVSLYPRAFKKTVDGDWAHLACAIYYPEMHFRQGNRFEGFSSSSLDPRRARLRCQICKSRSGFCLQCSAKSCAKSFHPMCARISQTPLYFGVADDDALETRIWCTDHASNALASKNIKSPRRLEWQPATVSTRQSANSDWHFTETLHFFPRNKGYRTEERNALFQQYADTPDDKNRWRIVSTTDLRSRAAFDAHELIATQWEETILGGLEPIIERRMSRKAVGYSALSNPSGEVLAAANWNFWEVNSEIVCLCIKFMVCKRFTAHHISMRRKRCGSLLAAHLVDLALSRRRVQWVLVCSESGYPEKFWNSLGFEEIPKRERAGFSVVSEAELNPFRDTVLMRLTRPKVLKNAGYSLTSKAFVKWSQKHQSENLKVRITCGKQVVREDQLPLF